MGRNIRRKVMPVGGFRKVRHYLTENRRLMRKQAEIVVNRMTTYNWRPCGFFGKNEKFIRFYKSMGICKEEEWDIFYKFMKTDLPPSFRITGSKCIAKKIIKNLEYLKVLNEEFKLDIFPLPWYPDNLAWQLNLTEDIRRNEAFHKLCTFLSRGIDNETISSQEAVSMIPPIVLDVQPHHSVLDMCAVPELNTAQLLEMLHAGDAPIPSGYVIANDVNIMPQVRGPKSPCLAVVKHDSTLFPNHTISLPDGSTEQVKFDRVLCDVPCSGDGTLRNNHGMWSKWTPTKAIKMHLEQSLIIRRGCELLKVGGRLVYSTCSLNPLENEAVIHRLLAETDGVLKLIDVSASLPGLKFTPGMESWVVGSTDLQFYKNWEEVDKKWRTMIQPQMFPPKEADRGKYQLNKCIRILPHQQNTGGFFMAVLEKIKPLIEKSEIMLKRNERRRRRKGVFKIEDPFRFFNEDEVVWPDIKKYYEISDQIDPKCLLVRSRLLERINNIFLTSQVVRDLVQQNLDVIRFMSAGVKVFIGGGKYGFRLDNEGLGSICNSIGPSRKLYVLKDDLMMMLLNSRSRFESLSEVVKKQVMNSGKGSRVLIYTEKNEGEDKLVLHLRGYQGLRSLSIYPVAQCYKVYLLRLLGADTKYS